MALSRARERLLRRISTRRGREAEGVVLLEGARALGTAMEFGAEIAFAVVDGSAGPTDHAETLGALEARGVAVDRVESAAFQELAATETPQGILAVAREPRPSWPPGTAPASGNRGDGEEYSGRVLVLDRVRDPGNVGTLVRTAAALGVTEVVALPGTADPWGAKVVRASAGTVFGLPVHSVGWKDFEAWLDDTATPLLVADIGGGDVRDHLASGAWALLVSNEGSGPSDAAVERADAVISIPLSGGVESLNVGVAGAILLWALGPASRQESTS